MFKFLKNKIFKKDSIIIFALPKSASKTIVHSLKKKLNYDLCNVGSDIYFLDDVINKYHLFNNLKKKKILYDHIPASPYNKKILEFISKDQKIVILIRDPRYATFSFANFCRHVFENKLKFDEFSYFLNPKLEKQVMFYEKPKYYEYFFEHHYKHFIKWNEDWLEYIENKKDRFLLCKYSEFELDNVKFFNKILKFYNLNEIRNIKIFKIHKTLDNQQKRELIFNFLENNYFENLKKNYSGKFHEIFD